VRFLVFGGWFGSGNIGDDAILIGLRNILNNIFPKCELVALSTNPEQTIKTCGVESVHLPSPLDHFRGRVSSYYHALRDCDAVIVSGGTPIYDYGHISRSLNMGLPMAFKKKTFCMGIGSKQLSSTTSKIVTKKLLDNMESITVRDHPSRNELVKIGVRKTVKVTGDSALFLQNQGRRKRKYIIIAPRTLSQNFRDQYHSQLSKKNIERIRDNLAKSADYFIELGYPVGFLPMHKAGGDLNEINKIAHRMNSTDYTIFDVGTPLKACKVLSGAFLVLGLRLHSLILSAMLGIPVISVDYDPKIRGFMEQVGAEDYLLFPEDQPEKYLKTIDKVLNDNIIGLKMSDMVASIRNKILVEAGTLRDILVTQ